MSVSPLPSEIQQWTIDEVGAYLEKVGLAECSHVFKKRNVNGSALLNLTEDKLLLWSQDLKVIHIRKLSRLLSELNQQKAIAKLQKDGSRFKKEANNNILTTFGEEKNAPPNYLSTRKTEEKNNLFGNNTDNLPLRKKTEIIHNDVKPLQIRKAMVKTKLPERKFSADTVLPAPKASQGKERRISLESPRNNVKSNSKNSRKSFHHLDSDISKTLVQTLVLAEERGWNEAMENKPSEKQDVKIVPAPVLSESSFMVCHRTANFSVKKQQVIDGDYEIPEPVPSIQVKNLVDSSSTQSVVSSSASGTFYMPVIVNTESGPSLVEPSLKNNIKEENQNDESVYVTLSEEDEEDRLQRELNLAERCVDDGYEIPDARPMDDSLTSSLVDDIKLEPPAAFCTNSMVPVLPPRGEVVPPPRPLPLSPKQADDGRFEDTNKGKSGILETFKKISGSRFFPNSHPQHPISTIQMGQKFGSPTPEKDRTFITKSQISSPRPVSTSLPTLSDRPPVLPARSSPTTTPPSTPKRSSKVPGSPVLCQQKSASGLRPLPPLPQLTGCQGEEATCSAGINPLVGKPWYQQIGRKEAEILLRQGSNGTFLIRDSKHGGPSNPFTLSLLYESRVFHIFVRRRQDQTFALGSEKEHEMKFPTIDLLVLFYQKEALQLYCEGKPAGSTPLTTWPSSVEHV